MPFAVHERSVRVPAVTFTVAMLCMASLRAQSPAPMSVLTVQAAIEQEGAALQHHRTAAIDKEPIDPDARALAQRKARRLA